MPVESCTIDGKSGFRWGKKGKCYTGPDAKRKAEEQGRAIEADKHTMGSNIQSTEKLDIGLLVKSVPLMMDVADGEHPGVLSNEDLDGMMAQFAIRRSFGKLPRFIIRHNGEAFKSSPVKGRITSAKRDGPWIYVDLLITDPVTQEEYARGEHPSLSAEVYKFNDGITPPLLWAVASTLGSMAQFDIEKPDFMPSELTEELAQLASMSAEPVKFCADGRFVSASVSHEAKQTENKMPEETTTAATEKPVKIVELEAILARLEKAEQDIAKTRLEAEKRGLLLKMSRENRVLTEADEKLVYAAKNDAELAEVGKKLSEVPVAEKRKSYTGGAKVVETTSNIESANQFISKVMRESKLSRYDAVKALRRENPELFEAWISEVNGDREIFVNGRIVAARG